MTKNSFVVEVTFKRKESKLIWQIHISLWRCFGRVSSAYFQALMMKKLSYKESPFNKNNVATSKTSKILTISYY